MNMDHGLKEIVRLVTEGNQKTILNLQIINNKLEIKTYLSIF